MSIAAARLFLAFAIAGFAHSMLAVTPAQGSEVCDRITNVIGEVPVGFASFRGEKKEEGYWVATVAIGPFETCFVSVYDDGSEYSCEGAVTSNSERALEEFTEIVALVRRCLAGKGDRWRFRPATIRRATDRLELGTFIDVDTLNSIELSLAYREKTGSWTIEAVIRKLPPF